MMSPFDNTPLDPRSGPLDDVYAEWQDDEEAGALSQDDLTEFDLQGERLADHLSEAQEEAEELLDGWMAGEEIAWVCQDAVVKESVPAAALADTLMDEFTPGTIEANLEDEQL